MVDTDAASSAGHSSPERVHSEPESETDSAVEVKLSLGQEAEPGPKRALEPQEGTLHKLASLKAQPGSHHHFSDVEVFHHAPKCQQVSSCCCVQELYSISECCEKYTRISRPSHRPSPEYERNVVVHRSFARQGGNFFFARCRFNLPPSEISILLFFRSFYCR